MNAVRKELVKDAKPSINNIASPSVMDSKDTMGSTGSGNGETAAPESVPEMSETDRRLQKEVKKMNYKVRALEEKLSKIMKGKDFSNLTFKTMIEILKCLCVSFS